MKYRYCPKCGGNLKETFLNEEKQPRLKCQKCAFTKFKTDFFSFNFTWQ
ncbi:MAG: zinc ribbon domain-containing protein [Parcubacteria group bacterium]|nr:zinc ribbon domain-containing protein [Parcubacteria group bacterium]